MCGHWSPSYACQVVTPPARDAELRIGDAERERTIEALREHTGAGRLTLDELDDRIEAVAAARTRADLDAVVADLPRVTLASDLRRRREQERRELRDHVRTYLAVNLLLVVIWALTGAGGAWFIWPLLGWGIGLAAHAIP